MTTSVPDCSLAMAWVFPDEATEATNRLLDALTDGRAFVPALWPVEVADVLLVATRRRRIAETDESPRPMGRGSCEVSTPSRSGSIPSPPRASGMKSSKSRMPITSLSTTPCIWSRRSGCGCRWPRWMERSRPPAVPRDSTCRPWRGGEAVHADGAKPDRPRAGPSMNLYFPPTSAAASGRACFVAIRRVVSSASTECGANGRRVARPGIFSGGWKRGSPVASSIGWRPAR